IEKAAGKIWMEIKINGFWFPLSEVSDGTIHLLLLLMMLNLPENSGISMLAIDEPEMNLHPAWQKLLANEILRCKSFKQSFISTHSPDFLDELTTGFLEGEVAVFVFDPLSKTNIRKLDKEELKADLQEWILGDLYRVGDPMIGGWPQ
ncbi:MAG: AAA family ATPase, partial [Acetivibrio ethanolgignens]